MSPLNVEEQLRALREQALGREPGPDAWPRLQRRLRREPTRRAVLVAGLALVVLAVAVAPGLLARRSEQPTVPTVGTPVVPGRPVVTRVDRTRPGKLYRIDPATNRVLGRPLTLPRIVPAPYVGVAVGEGIVVVKDIDERTLIRIELVP